MKTIERRLFLQSMAVPSALLAVTPVKAAGGSYSVGVGHSDEPYRAAKTAINACGQFPSKQMAGKTVIIKPNLVIDAPSNSGITTDPQVVRAVVDLALAAGAAQVVIAEGSCVQPAPFAACGYGFFLTYDPQGRIQLVDLCQRAVSLVKVPGGGMVHRRLWLPDTVIGPDAIFISVAKLKTHLSVGATLSMKNLVGMASPTIYGVANQWPRQDLHNRGIAESIIDLNTTRPIDFAVIDGVWGMEGQGPTSGTAIEADLVFAGLNPLAVDMVAVSAMGIPQNTVPYLSYAAGMGMGPSGLGSITIRGDAFTPMAFAPAVSPPIVWRPNPNPTSIGPGQSSSISYAIPLACETRFEIIQDSDQTPDVVLVRTLHDWETRPPGTETMIWNGMSDAGAAVAPGWYLARVQARFGPTDAVNYASALMTVKA